MGEVVGYLVQLALVRAYRVHEPKASDCVGSGSSDVAFVKGWASAA